MKKLLNKKGFTLMEMMIVIAIIVILVAISIPTFSGSLDKANAATDAANLRAAKAAFVSYEMDGTAATNKWYDVETGTVVDANPTTDGQGKCSNHEGYSIKWNGNDAVWSDGTNVSPDCETPGAAPTPAP